MPITAPSPFDPETARITDTAIAAIGVHQVTNQIEALYFTSAAELEDYLGFRDHRSNTSVFDLDRETGRWDAR
jgi:hypothetical protein